MNKKQVLEVLKKNTHVNINLGAGDSPQPGFILVDKIKYPNIDVVCDLEKFPWPFPDECADLLMASQLVEHIKPWLFLDFMAEAWRILKPKGHFMIATPYAGSPGFWQDPTHCAGFNELTWSYFDPLDATSNGMLYLNYRPKPWKIIENSWFSNGNLETVLEKRPDDPSYHKEEK